MVSGVRLKPIRYGCIQVKCGCSWNISIYIQLNSIDRMALWKPEIIRSLPAHPCTA